MKELLFTCDATVLDDTHWYQLARAVETVERVQATFITDLPAVGQAGYDDRIADMRAAISQTLQTVLNRPVTIQDGIRSGGDNARVMFIIS